MARRTKKVGIAGKYGVRYGVRVRKRLKDVGEHTSRRHRCPQCHHRSVRRKSTGVWHCRKCGTTFAGGAYRPVVARGFRREVSRRDLDWEALEEDELWALSEEAMAEEE